MPEESSPSPTPCLWCKAPLPEPLEQTTQCTACGRRNRREDLAVFHTLAPRARRLQTTVELASAALLGYSFFRAVAHWKHLKGGDLGIGMTVLLPAVAGLTALFLARFITRRRRGPLIHVSPAGCGVVAFGAASYFAYLQFGVMELEGGLLYASIAVLVITAGALGARLWAQSRRRAA